MSYDGNMKLSKMLDKQKKTIVEYDGRYNKMKMKRYYFPEIMTVEYVKAFWVAEDKAWDNLKSGFDAVLECNHQVIDQLIDNHKYLKELEERERKLMIRKINNRKQHPIVTATDNSNVEDDTDTTQRPSKSTEEVAEDGYSFPEDSLNTSSDDLLISWLPPTKGRNLVKKSVKKSIQDPQKEDTSSSSSDDTLIALLRSKQRRNLVEEDTEDASILDNASFSPSEKRKEDEKPAPLKKCHQCETVKKRGGHCKNCKEKYYCEACIKKWYPRLQKTDIENRCPFCCSNCNCKECLKSRIEIPDINLDDNVKLQHLHYLLRLLIPFVNQFYKEQKAELLMEANARGVPTSELTTQSKPSKGERVICCFCSTSIVGLLRSCQKCDYDLCLTCCQEIRNNKPLQNVAEFGECGKAVQYWHVHTGNNIATISKPVITNAEIMCPDDNSVLELMHTSEINWISTLEDRANSVFKTINPTYIEPQQLDDICGTNFKAASSRIGSDDNDLYWPVSKDVSDKDDLTRFR